MCRKEIIVYGDHIRYLQNITANTFTVRILKYDEFLQENFDL